ncbi:MAG TPA: peptidoglycan-binding domain-containing protein [Coleofasciculaceae cyanobacterium]
MKSLLLIHPASAEPHSEDSSKLKPFKLQTWKMSRVACTGLLSLATIASILSIAPQALAALRFGDTGSEVSRLQNALGIPADGIFGSQTEAAVLSYQRQCGLQVDGIAGTQTLSSLAAGSCSGGFVPLLPSEGGSGGSGGSVGTGPYVVVVPGVSSDRLAAVQQIVPGARYDNSGRGTFINAGGYQTRSGAEGISNRLNNVGLPARVDFRP